MTILSTASDGARSWRPYHDASESRTTEHGHLILCINYLYDAEGERIIVEWANATGFSLSDVSPHGALTMLLHSTIYQALADVPDDSPLVEAMRAVNQGGPTSLLPEFRVIVDGTFAISLIVESFLGPFHEMEHFLNAIDQRLIKASPLRREDVGCW